MLIDIAGPLLEVPSFGISQDAITELSNIAIGCNKYGLVCTEQAEFDKFAIAICIVGMLLGVICTLAFQYTRKKAEEKIMRDNIAELVK